MASKKVAIYARVSTDKKEGHSTRQHTENQLDQMRAFCEREGWQVVYEFVEHEKGSKADRAELNKLFEKAKTRDFDLVLFWALDRFSREGALATLQRLQLLSHYGKDFYSYTEPFLNTLGAFRDVVIAMLATLAKQENIRRSERVKAGLERAKKEGKRLGRKPVPDSKIREVQKLKGQGLSVRKIAEQVGLSRGKVGQVVKNG